MYSNTNCYARLWQKATTSVASVEADRRRCIKKPLVICQKILNYKIWVPKQFKYPPSRLAESPCGSPRSIFPFREARLRFEC